MDYVRRETEQAPDSVYAGLQFAILGNYLDFSALGDKVSFDTLSGMLEKARDIRRFASYYLPDAVKILTTYAKMEQQGVRGENADALRAEVEKNAAAIATAFENQLDALYSAEVLDIGADLDVLKSLMKGQGL